MGREKSSGRMAVLRAVFKAGGHVIRSMNKIREDTVGCHGEEHPRELGQHMRVS